MKKSSLIIVLLISILCLKINAIAQIIVPINPIVMTRVDYIPAGTAGNAPVPVTVTLKNAFGFFVQSESKTFQPNINQTHQYTSVAPASAGMRIDVLIDGLSNQGTYYLPTTVNQETVVSGGDCGMRSVSRQIGYSVTIKCVAPNQYIVSTAKFYCYKCVPCDPPTLRKP